MEDSREVYRKQWHTSECSNILSSKPTAVEQFEAEASDQISASKSVKRLGSQKSHAYNSSPDPIKGSILKFQIVEEWNNSIEREREIPKTRISQLI